MKFKISYFYHVRNLAPNQVPVSTAKYDPKWFHNNKGHGHVFIDKRGVINGLRIPVLSPQDNPNAQCCGPATCKTNPNDCLFLKCYEDQLNGVDFHALIKNIEESVRYYNSKNPKSCSAEPECILMVYEKPDNPCSERHALVKWFKDNGYILEEYER